MGATMALTVSFFSLSFLASLLAGYVLFRILYQVLHYRLFHPLAQFPGPFWGSVTRLWITYHNVMGREVDVCDALHKKHGPIVRITPTMLLVDDATKLPLIYHRTADKTQHYISGSAGPADSLFNMQEHKVHAHFRKIAAPPYSFTNIKRMEPLINAQIVHWLSRLDTLFASPDSNGGQPVPFNFCPWAVYMAFDVISEVGFGAPFGFVSQGRDVAGLIRAIKVGLLPFGVMSRLYPLTTWLKTTRFGKKYLVATPEDRNGFGAMMRFRDALIADRLDQICRGAKPRFDLLQTFLDARDADDRPLDIEYVKAEVLLVMLAGADTTATTFQALVTHLFANPHAFARVTREIDGADAGGKLSTPVPSYEEVQTHCPYYVACVRETLRLNPPVPGIFPRLVGKGGMELGGRHVPEGLEVTANPYLVHRDTNIYGADAGAFRPERWLESEEQAREYARYSMAFGYGSRTCLGVHVAHMELFKAPLQLFRTFDVQLCDPARPAKYSVQGGVASFYDMWVTITRRKKGTGMGGNAVVN